MGGVSAENRLVSSRKHLARPLQISGSIDTERNGVNERHVDAHAVLERAQLLELFTLFERRRRERYEPLQRRTAEAIDAEMMIERAFAEGRRRRG